MVHSEPSGDHVPADIQIGSAQARNVAGMSLGVAQLESRANLYRQSAVGPVSMATDKLFTVEVVSD